MGATKKYLVQMREQEYCSIPAHIRHAFISDKVIYDDYEIYKDDLVFQQLYKEKKRASKKLDDWKYNKRNNHQK